MKKFLLFAGLAAATLSFVGCNKEADVKGLDGRPVEIILSDAATRTVNNGMGTQWENGDALNVFTAPAGSTEYSANAKFEVDDAANNHAKGTAELTADAYDWYLLYPYSSYVTTPANTKSGYLAIGSKSNATQTQAGPDSMAHLSGENLPVYGVAKNVARDDTPVISMKHVASVVAINLTNATAAPIKVDEVSFTAPEDIVGTYYIDFSGEELAFAGSGANYVSNVATLAVTGDATIAAGASAKFYLAVKPFAAKAADKLSVKAHVGDLVFEKEIFLPSAVEFKSGFIKQLNVSYTGGTEIQGSSLEDIIAMDKDAEVQTNEVLVVAKYARGIMLAENGSYLLAFNNAGVTGEVGDIVTVSGKVGEYAGLKQIASPEVTVVSSDNEVVLPEPKVLETLDEYASDQVELIQFTGTLAVSGNYFNVNVTGSTRKGSIQYPLDAEELKALDKKPITAIGFFTGITGNGSYVNMMSTTVEEAAVNVFEVTPQQINVDATVTTAEINVTGNVDWTAEPSEGASVDKASGSGDGVITVSFPANTDPENTKEYTVFVRTEATGVNDEFEVSITQAKADAAGVSTVTIDFSAQGYENGAEVTEVSENGVTVTFDKGTGANVPKYYSTGTAVRTYGGNTFTVNADGKTIVSIEITFSSGEGSNAITTDVPTYAEPLWTGEAGSVTFTVGGTSGHRRIKAITVKYSGEAAPAATLESIAVSGQKTAFNVGDTFVFDGKVTATYSDGSTKEVQPTEVSKPDMSTAGTKEVTVTYKEGEKTATAKYEITVSASVVDGNTLSITMSQYVEDHGCTVSSGSDATMYKTLQLNESVRMSTTGADNCGSFWNTSSSNDTKQWRLYQKQNGNVIITVAEGCELKSVKFTYVVTNTGILLDTQGNQVASDDTQTVSGTSVTYTVGNSGTVDNGQVRITAVEVVYTGDGTTFPDQPSEVTTTISLPSNHNVYVGETFALNASSNVAEATITYESEDPSIATVDASGVVTGVAEGTVKVYARIAGVEGKYTDAEKYCNVTVTTKPAETEGTVVFDQDYLAANKNGSKDVISYTNSSDYGTTVPTELRVYKSNTLVVSASEGYKITSIKMTCMAKGTAKQGPGCWGAGAPEGYSFEADGFVGTWTGSASSVSFTATDNQVRITELVVTYE